MRSICLVGILGILHSQASAGEAPAWVAAMKKVHAKFTGKPGTLALFGDSITVSMAFWAPLRGEPKNMPDDMARAHKLVKSYMHRDCWVKGRGPEFGNQGSMTIRWAHENVDRWLKAHNPEAAVIMFGTNDLGQLQLEEFEEKTGAVVDRCLQNGTVVLLTTLPPRHGLLEKSTQFADAVRRIAKQKQVPLIDYHAEILKRRPDDWDGALPKFKETPGGEYEVPTLLARDGVHPSNPRGHRDFSEDSLKKNGYLLRNYVTLLAYADVIRQVLGPEKGAGRPRPPAFPFAATAAQRYQREYAAAAGLPVEYVNDVGIRFVLVPPGTFRMGSPENEPGRNGGGYIESPAHIVTLTRPFYLGKHEVTIGQFRRFVQATKYVTDGEQSGGGNAHDEKAVWKHRPGTNWLKPGYAGPFEMKDDHPVVHVSHTDALAFCKWLNEQTDADKKGTHSLPTEAQWEWACRAGSGDRFWWGPDEDTTGKVANVGDRTLKRVHPEWPRTIMPMDDGHAFPAPVGSYRANGFGLHDMLGNVWEFCSTQYGPYPKGPVLDPTDGDPKRGFAVRGGGWSNQAGDARCATRNADPPHFCHSNLGFRVALVLRQP